MKIIELKNCANIRDISYGNIKEKKLIRSSALDKLSTDDILKLKNEYNLSVVIDLRCDKELNELQKMPDVVYFNIPLVDSETLGITKGDTTEEKLHNLQSKMPDMCILYKQLVTKDKKEKWQKIFNILLNNESGAVLWHCEQGKDRCGIVSAIILYALGIDYATILEDYLFTNKFYESKALKIYKLMYEISDSTEIADRAKNLFLAKKEYLDSAFDFIEKEYGSMDLFLNDMCGLNEEKITELKEMYLK